MVGRSGLLLSMQEFEEVSPDFLTRAALNSFSEKCVSSVFRNEGNTLSYYAYILSRYTTRFVIIAFLFFYVYHNLVEFCFIGFRDSVLC